MFDDDVPVRARIGLIIPSSNRMTEPQFHRHCPPGVSPHVTRLRLTQPHMRPPLEMLPEIRDAAVMLAHAKCDIIVFHCTGSSMESGLAAERQVVDFIAQTTGRPAASTATALLEAFQALHAARIVLVSPYQQQINDVEIAFLREAGVQVLGDRALSLPGSDAFCSAPAELFLQATLDAQDPEADAYFISCTNIRAMETVARLEPALGKPVVTSNQATLWYCLRRLGFSDNLTELGTLFSIDMAVAPAR